MYILTKYEHKKKSNIIDIHYITPIVWRQNGMEAMLVNSLYALILYMYIWIVIYDLFVKRITSRTNDIL